MSKRTLSKSPAATAPNTSVSSVQPNGKPAVALPFRPVASQVTHDANPVLVCLYEARTSDGRIMLIQLTNGLNAVSWDGTLNEDGSPKVSINANMSASASWKPSTEKATTSLPLEN